MWKVCRLGEPAATKSVVADAATAGPWCADGIAFFVIHVSPGGEYASTTAPAGASPPHRYIVLPTVATAPTPPTPPAAPERVVGGLLTYDHVSVLTTYFVACVIGGTMPNW